MKVLGDVCKRDYLDLVKALRGLLEYKLNIFFSNNLRQFKLDEGAVEWAWMKVNDLTKPNYSWRFQRNPKIHHVVITKERLEGLPSLDYILFSGQQCCLCDDALAIVSANEVRDSQLTTKIDVQIGSTTLSFIRAARIPVLSEC